MIQCFIWLGICSVLSTAKLISVECNSDPTTDSNEIDGAVNVAQSGDRIVVHGTCIVTQTVRLKGGVMYTGDSRQGSIIRQSNNTHLSAVLASDVWLDNRAWTGSPVQVRHLTIDGNAVNNGMGGTAGIVLQSWQSVVDDVLVVNSGSDGIRVTGLASDNKTTITTSQVNGRISNCFIENSARHGVYVQDPGNGCTDWYLLDNWIASSNQSAIHLENAAGWQVRNNHLYGVGLHGVYAHRCFGSSVDNNYIENFGGRAAALQPNVSDFYGIYASVQSGASSTVTGNKVLQLDGRPVGPGTFDFIHVKLNGGTGIINVVNNAIRGVAGKGPPLTGLAYINGVANGNLMLMSASNNVQLVDVPRRISGNVTLVTGL